MDFEIFQIADISTKYITAEDGELVQSDTAPFHIAKTDPPDSAGDIFCVPLDRSAEEVCKELGYYDFSEAFQNLFRRLHAAGIPYVRFDVDGGEVKDAPEFDW